MPDVNSLIEIIPGKTSRGKMQLNLPLNLSKVPFVAKEKTYLLSPLSKLSQPKTMSAPMYVFDWLRSLEFEFVGEEQFRLLLNKIQVGKSSIDAYALGKQKNKAFAEARNDPYVQSQVRATRAYLIPYFDQWLSSLPLERLDTGMYTWAPQKVLSLLEVLSTNPELGDDYPTTNIDDILVRRRFFKRLLLLNTNPLEMDIETRLYYTSLQMVLLRKTGWPLGLPSIDENKQAVINWALSHQDTDPVFKELADELCACVK